MEKLYLEEPSLKREKDVINYLEEFIEYNSDINGVGCLDKCLDGLTYQECLDELIKREDESYVKSINRCQSKTFLVIRENDKKIVGMINVRYNIPEDKLNTWASHIGYSVRPTERRKGYAKYALYLALIEEQKLGEAHVLLDCTVDNIGSNKTIQALGGILNKTAIDKEDNEMTNYYWIDVNKSIQEYKPIYK